MRFARRIDAALLATPRRLQYLLMLVTLAAMIWQALPQVPKEFIDFSRISLLSNIPQEPTFGTDTIADAYEARVVLNDPLDMYTKRKVDQTAVEAATWTKAESAPYPPAVLLAEAGLLRLGQWTTLGFYGMVLLLAAIFVLTSAWYFLQTRWYLFPLLYLNFSYFGHRFVAVQDGSYLVMLVTIVAALLLARAGRPLCHLLMAVAIDMKLSPLYYAKNVLRMPRPIAWAFAAIVVAGLIAPFFIWENYAYIFLFHDELKGSTGGTVAGLLCGAVFALMLWYVETRLNCDWEDRIGWGLVPFAMFLAMKMNVPRHLLIVLLIPDKRALRNLIAAFALLVPVVLPVRFGATLPIATVLLFGVLTTRLSHIGWGAVRDDIGHPVRTLMLMLGRAEL